MLALLARLKRRDLIASAFAALSRLGSGDHLSSNEVVEMALALTKKNKTKAAGCRRDLLLK